MLQNIFCGFQVVWIWVLLYKCAQPGFPGTLPMTYLKLNLSLLDLSASTLTVQDLNQTLQNSEGSMGFELGTDPAPQVSRVWRSTWRVRWTWYTYNPYNPYSNPFIPITNILTKLTLQVAVLQFQVERNQVQYRREGKDPLRCRRGVFSCQSSKRFMV